MLGWRKASLLQEAGLVPAHCRANPSIGMAGALTVLLGKPTSYWAAGQRAAGVSHADWTA